MIKSIHIVSTSYGAFDRRILRIKETLQNSGHKVVWHCRSRNVKDKNYFATIKTIFSRGILFYLEFNIRCFAILMRSSSDVFYAVDLDTLGGVYLAARLKKKPFVFDSHEYFTEVPELKNRVLKKRIWEILATSIIPNSKYNITVNHSLAKLFKEKYQVPFSVIRNVPPLLDGLDSFKTSKNSKLIIYQGAVNLGRGLELAIEAMRELKKYKLLILGDGDLFIEIEKKIKTYDLGNRIEMKGFVDPKELAGYTKEAFLGLNMLDPISDNYKYSLANKFFDYMHAGIPSINMDFPEYRLINHRFPVSYLCNDYTVASLIEAIKFYENPKMYQASIKALPGAIQSFNWQKESHRLIDFVNKI